jgi:hypothetical protein
MTFFERIQSVAAEDYLGGRAKIRVYRLAPLINRNSGSDTKFITMYAEPVTEDKIKVDHGSGRYRLYLNWQGPGGAKSKEIDQVEIDILDPMFPPKIPSGEWMDDPRNKQWAWAKPYTAPGSQTAPTSSSPLESLNTFMDIQDRIEERLKPATPGTAAAPAAVDPWTAAEKILSMRAENPMLEILKTQQTAAAAALEAERERTYKAQEAAREREAKANEANREREFQLQKQLLEATTKAAAPTKGLFEQLMEADENKMGMIKRLFNWGTGEGNGTTRRTTGLDLAREIGEKIFTGPVGEGLGQWIATRSAPQAAHTNGANGAIHQPAAQAQPAGDLQSFVQNVINPALLSHYVRGLTGSDFAAWLADGYPDRLKQMQNFTHPMIPLQRGAQAIITAYKNTATMWPTLSSQGEEAFAEFVREFCAWTPDQDEGVIDAEEITDEPEHEEEPERI